jgi:hypothetical protein
MAAAQGDDHAWVVSSDLNPNELLKAENVQQLRLPGRGRQNMQRLDTASGSTCQMKDASFTRMWDIPPNCIDPVRGKAGHLWRGQERTGHCATTKVI